MATRNPYYQGPVSDHFDGVRFFNPGCPNINPGFGPLLRWRLLGRRAAWPVTVPVTKAVPDAAVAGLRVTMVGHASLLIQLAGHNFLVDPVWSERASPLAWAGPRRVTAPGVDFEKLPPIDAVLLTHNHFDHLDMATLKKLWRVHQPRIVAPLGNDAVVAGGAPEIRVETYDWGDAVEVRSGLTVRLHPAQHWSARGVLDRRMALWCGFVIRSPVGSVYVAGDTGYGDGQIFRALRPETLDLAILPIGAYEPRWFMRSQHADPDEAVQMLLDCGARQALGVHWGTFNLTDEPRLEPPARLAAVLQRRGLPAESFIPMEAGGVWSPI